MRAGSKVKVPAAGYTTAGAGVKVAWSSSNPKIAKVSKTGVIRGKKAGKAIISAKAGTKTTTITVRVVSNKALTRPAKIKAAKFTRSLKVGQAAYVNGVVKPGRAASGVVKFRTSNKAVFKVTKTGRIIATGKGSAKLTLKLNTLKKKYKITVN